MCIYNTKTSCLQTFPQELLFSATFLHALRLAIANQNKARPKFLSTLCKSGTSPTQNLGQVSLGRAQVFSVHTSMDQARVFESLGRAWASLCSVDTATNTEVAVFLTFNEARYPYKRVFWRECLKERKDEDDLEYSGVNVRGWLGMKFFECKRKAEKNKDYSMTVNL